MFRPGQEVYCVNDTDRVGIKKHFTTWVTQGVSYTVRRSEGSLTGQARLLLEEIINPKVFVPELGGRVEPGFAAKRFISKEEYLMGTTETAVNEEELVIN